MLLKAGVSDGSKGINYRTNKSIPRVVRVSFSNVDFAFIGMDERI